MICMACLVLHVDDNGCGMPEAQQNPVSESLNTSKGMGAKKLPIRTGEDRRKGGL